MTLIGGGGDDIVLGGGGKDKLIGASGNDTLNGGPGADVALYPGKRITDLPAGAGDASYDQAYGLVLRSDDTLVAAGQTWTAASGGDFALVRYGAGETDTTPPRVKSASPTGKKVLPGANVTAVFSEAIKEGTITKSTFKLVRKGTTKKLAAKLATSPRKTRRFSIRSTSSSAASPTRPR